MKATGLSQRCVVEGSKLLVGQNRSVEVQRSRTDEYIPPDLGRSQQLNAVKHESVIHVREIVTQRQRPERIPWRDHGATVLWYISVSVEQTKWNER